MKQILQRNSKMFVNWRKSSKMKSFFFKLSIDIILLGNFDLPTFKLLETPKVQCNCSHLTRKSGAKHTLLFPFSLLVNAYSKQSIVPAAHLTQAPVNAVWWFQQEQPPQTHIFECSGPSWWNHLEMISGYDLVGGSVSLRVGFEVRKSPTISSFSIAMDEM